MACCKIPDFSIIAGEDPGFVQIQQTQANHILKHSGHVVESMHITFCKCEWHHNGACSTSTPICDLPVQKLVALNSTYWDVHIDFNGVVNLFAQRKMKLDFLFLHFWFSW